MNNNNIFSTYHSTSPVQDKFGGVLIQFGASKIEVATIQIASAMVANSVTYNGGLLPEAIAEEAYNIALAVFEKVDEEFKKAAAAQQGTGLIVDK